MSNNRIFSIFGILLTAGASACALPPSNDADDAPVSSTIPLVVANESPELVRIVFISDGGHRFPIGTVSGYTTSTLAARVNPYVSGYLYVHRQSEDAPTQMQGTFETFGFRNQAVVVRVGPSASFDYWQVIPKGAVLTWQPPRAQ